MIFVVSFFLYGFLGWVLDTTYRSVTSGKWSPGTLLPIPFAPIYGFGSLIVLALGPLIEMYSIVLQFLIFVVVLAAYEYVCGQLLQIVLHRRLWDYRRSRFHLHGHTDLFHALIWGILALVLLYAIHPIVFMLFTAH